jgi:indolepyruvate ferredoxin oxidoreductase alpha subunit
VECLEVTDAFDLESTERAIKKAFAYEGVSVVVSRRGCALETTRDALRSGKPQVPYQVNQDDCIQCYICLADLACPAMTRDGDKVDIDPAICTGCSVCAQVCPTQAIVTVQR